MSRDSSYRSRQNRSYASQQSATRPRWFRDANASPFPRPEERNVPRESRAARRSATIRPDRCQARDESAPSTDRLLLQRTARGKQCHNRRDRSLRQVRPRGVCLRHRLKDCPPRGRAPPPGIRRGSPPDPPLRQGRHRPPGLVVGT